MAMRLRGQCAAAALRRTVLPARSAGEADPMMRTFGIDGRWTVRLMHWLDSGWPGRYIDGTPAKSSTPMRVASRRAARPCSHQSLRTWNWAIAETGIVVAGILIAFSLNSWWEGRSAAAREQAHLHALRADFEQNVTQLQYLVEFQERVSDASGQLLLIARGHRAPAPDTIEHLMGQVFMSNRFDAVMGAYEGLVNAGGLAKIRDDSLRSALAAFASMLDSRYAEQFSTALYLDFTREFVGRLGWADAVLRWEIAQEDGHAQDGAGIDYDSLLSDPGFQDHLALRFLTERDVASAYRSLARQAEEVLDRVDALVR